MMLRNRILLSISTLSVICLPSTADQQSLTANGLIEAKLCFGEFVPILNGIVYQFSTNYQDCLMDGKQGELDDDSYGVKKCQTASKRMYIESTAITFTELNYCLKEAESILLASMELASFYGNEPEIKTKTDALLSKVEADETKKITGPKRTMSNLWLSLNT